MGKRYNGSLSCANNMCTESSQLDDLTPLIDFVKTTFISSVESDVTNSVTNPFGPPRLRIQPLLDACEESLVGEFCVLN